MSEHAHHALVAGQEPGDAGGGGGVDAEQSPGHVPGRAQHPAEGHVHAVIVGRRKIQRREGPAAQLRRPRQVRRQQRLERVGVALGLHQPGALQAADLAHAAVDRGDEHRRVRIAGARRRAQRAREEGVEALVLERIGLLGLAHVRLEAVHEAADERIFDERHAAARDAVREAREPVLRQQVLQDDEQPRAHATGRSRVHRYGAARRRSAASAGTSKGGVKIAAMRARASSRNSTAEWSMV